MIVLLGLLGSGYDEATSHITAAKQQMESLAGKNVAFFTSKCCVHLDLTEQGALCELHMLKNQPYLPGTTPVF